MELESSFLAEGASLLTYQFLWLCFTKTARLGVGDPRQCLVVLTPYAARKSVAGDRILGYQWPSI